MFINKFINDLVLFNEQLKNKPIPNINNGDNWDNSKIENNKLDVFEVKLNSISTSLLLNFDDIFTRNWGLHENWNWGSISREQKILLLANEEVLKNRDKSRSFLWSVNFANDFFRLIIKSEDNFDNVNGNISKLQENNPFKEKYKDKFTRENLKDENFKFELLKEYLNQVSFAIDAAWIWWMTWTTDFTQLYNCINDENIVNQNKKSDIIKKLFDMLNSDNIEIFNNLYNKFIDELKKSNINENSKLTRLYNRLWYIFSYILNNLNPQTFPIYFPRTRDVLKLFNIEDYMWVCQFYNSFLTDNYDSAEWYYKKVSLDSHKFKTIISINNSLIKDHSKYRFFQDTMWYIANMLLNQKNHLRVILYTNYKKWANFTLSDVYKISKQTFETWFKWTNLNAKIRQLLQQSRDDWVIEFLWNWSYKLLKNFSDWFTFFD